MKVSAHYMSLLVSVFSSWHYICICLFTWDAMCSYLLLSSHLFVFTLLRGWNTEIIESLNSRKYKKLTYYSLLKKHIDTSKKSTKGAIISLHICTLNMKQTTLNLSCLFIFIVLDLTSAAVKKIARSLYHCFRPKLGHQFTTQLQ